MDITELETERLILRQWRETDYPLFAKLNADKQVMKYILSPLSPEESDTLAGICASLISTRGWGLWAVELRSTDSFIGFVGLHVPKDTLPFPPSLEIGWRLAKQYWGYGYATEAASTVLKFAFETLNLNEVISFTSVDNYPSRSVMERIGLINTNQNFQHIDLPLEHKLAEHVLYKITKSEWQDNNSDLQAILDRADEPSVSYEQLLNELDSHKEV
ncbi:MAG: GNAT family N-acetyltransferase [Porticoccaceae bacterium]|nr:GNAT family N-acetyltransferase [Porticoccaceae bacterium]